MKRSFVFLLAVMFVCSFSGLTQASVDNIYEVAVVNLRGDVEVDTNADGAWIKPWVGLKLMEDAHLKTHDRSMLDMVFDSEGLNVVRVTENTHTTVKKALLVLADGKVLADFGNLTPGSSFTVRTPNAACVIRGSGMGVAYSNGSTTVMSFSGNTYVQGLDPAGNPVGPETTIPEGQQADVDSDGNVGDTEDVESGDRSDYNNLADTYGTGDPGSYDGGPGDIDNDPDTKDLDETRIKVKDDSGDISPSNGGGNGEPEGE